MPIGFHTARGNVPVFVVHSQAQNVLGNIHHPNFGKYLKAEMDKAGIECISHMDTDYPGGPAEQTRDMFQWMKKHFGM